MRRLFRFLKALWRYMLYGKRVSFGKYAYRIYQCHQCYDLDRDKWACKKCGCYVTKKAKMSTEKCPESKW